MSGGLSRSAGLNTPDQLGMASLRPDEMKVKLILIIFSLIINAVLAARPLRDQDCVPERIDLEQLDTNNAIYAKEDIITHLGASMDEIEFVSSSDYTLSCVDARGHDWMLGTAGGEFAELVLALDTYLNVTSRPTPSYARVKDFFQVYVDMRAESLSISEGVFLHTDNIKIAKILRDLNVTWDVAAGVVPPVSAQPALLDALTSPENQGCSHLKYMMMYPAEYGVNPDVAKLLMRAYFETLWTDPVRARHLEFVIFQGQQTGASAVLVEVKGTCKGQSPIAVPRESSYFGSSLFVAHTSALGDFRRNVLAEWFANTEPPIADLDSFAAKLNERALKQLTSTVSHINPRMPVYKLTVTASAPQVVPPLVIGLIVVSILFFILAVALMGGLIYYVRKYKIFSRNIAILSADYSQVDDNLQEPLRGTLA